MIQRTAKEDWMLRMILPYFEEDLRDVVTLKHTELYVYTPTRLVAT